MAMAVSFPSLSRLKNPTIVLSFSLLFLLSLLLFPSKPPSLPISDSVRPDPEPDRTGPTDPDPPKGEPDAGDTPSSTDPDPLAATSEKYNGTDPVPANLAMVEKDNGIGVTDANSSEVKAAGGSRVTNASDGSGATNASDGSEVTNANDGLGVTNASDESGVMGEEERDNGSGVTGSEEVDGSGVTGSEEVDESGVTREVEEMGGKCDLYQGKWVKDEEGRYPLYEAGSCPYVDEAYACKDNGRTDSDFMKWRWKPDGCDLPRFNATDFLERLRGKRLMLVGDSMNRNQYESMLCLLREALPDKSKMYETRGYKITKGRGYFVFLFVDYECTVEFVRSHFLVREGVRINNQGNSNPTLTIDRIDKSANRWKKADILIFNTGHWWTHGKTARGKNYYVEGGVLYPRFDAIEAFTRALKTWGRWIDDNMNKRNSLIIYRGYSTAHFRGGDWDSGGSCNGELEPASSGPIIDNYPLKMKIVEDVLSKMKVPVVLLNVTKLTNFRKDGHPSIYGTAPQKVSKRKQDCSHWCLPGVPDAWNELIYANLVLQEPHKA